MYKRILNTVGWTAVALVVVAAFKYFLGVNNWIEETLNWVIPAGSGFFFGYGTAQKDSKCK